MLTRDIKRLKLSPCVFANDPVIQGDLVVLEISLSGGVLGCKWPV